MSALTTTQQWLLVNNFGEISHYLPVGGGCINDTGRITLQSGETLFVKQHSQAPAGFFPAEAEGLRALQRENALRVPKVVHADEDFLLLEDLGNGEASSKFWQELGHRLATLHSTQKDSFGFTSDNFCGSTPQVNPITSDGFEFFGHYRLIALAAIAFDQRLLESKDLYAIESIAAKLQQLIPEQPCVLIHGDLWSGNIHCDKEGQPALIDPACYWGWAEAELAMTLLFGGFDRQFYSAYQANSKIEHDWRERSGIYNLYHLLNHLILFGTSYLGQVRTILGRY